MKNIIVGITGASGAAYGRRLVTCLADADVQVHLVVSPLGLRVVREELDIDARDVASLVGRDTDRVRVHAHRELGAPIASGSFLTHGMVICPCSSNTLAAVAGGIADNLITRAAAVTLKEARRLVIVPREMPLGQIEIGNMMRISQAGGIICPASPGFYLRPQRVEELVDFVVGRVLDLLGVEHDLRTRWAESQDCPKPPPGE
jgi:4-hydroxy-3-polyprenylbenzoate decarboxylase